MPGWVRRSGRWGLVRKCTKNKHKTLIEVHVSQEPQAVHNGAWVSSGAGLWRVSQAVVLGPAIASRLATAQRGTMIRGAA